MTPNQPQVLVFDIETDGLIPEMTMIHSLVIKNVTTGEVWSCDDVRGRNGYFIQDGLDLLMDADVIVGHNIVDFDIPAIQKLHPEFKPKGLIRDTIIMSRLIWANMRDADFRQADKGSWIQPHLIGRHSLESWGQRLGLWKGDYGKIKNDEGKALGLTGDALTRYVWGDWSQDMQDYCEQDVEVTAKLYERCLSKGFSERSIQLEHDVRRIVSRQERHGFAFDVEGATKLEALLRQALYDAEKELIQTFQPWFRDDGRDAPKIDRSVQQKHLPAIGMETYKKTGEPKRDKDGNIKYLYPKAHYSHEAPYTKVSLQPFNPGSRHDIANRLQVLFGWEPTEFTNDGHPKVDEEVLKSLPWKPAKLLTKYLLIQKRLGQIVDGKEAWLKHVRNGRIHGSVNTNGAVTGRMTHSRPNLAQVPGNGAPYGKDCRALFYAPKGKLLVGCDADALELRDLAGYMAAYDGGAYIKTVLEGNKDEGTDMHTLNAKALGCSRPVAKVWFYAFIYGAGDFKLGTILGVSGDKAKVTAAGKRSRAKFLRALPALNTLVTKVKAKAKKFGRLRGLDGRILHVRSEHSALNTLLQSAGAIQMKMALVLLDNALQEEHGLVPGLHYEFVGNIHDEWQIEVDEDKAHLVGRVAANAIRLAGEHLNFGCPLAGNYDVGTTWAETH